MNKTARASEADDVSAAFQIALAQMGVQTMEEAAALWSQVDPARAFETAGGWMDDAITMILSRRGRARALGIAYYRLVRALRTGSTVAAPGEGNPPRTVPLATLRREFRLLAEEQADGYEPSRSVRREWDRAKLNEPGPDLDKHDDEGTLDIDVEDIDWPDDEDEQDEATEEIVEKELRSVVIDLDKKRKAIAPEKEAEREKARQSSGTRQAGAAQRGVADAGRGVVYMAGSRDPKAVGYIRLSGTGSPCYFCAMLISRGAVYKSKKAATYDADGDRYHTNCFCFAEPIFSAAEYENNPRYKLNRELQAEWNAVTKNALGAEKLRVWRRYIRNKRAMARNEASAQAA